MPSVPAVMATAMLTRRLPTALAVILSLAVNIALVSRESLTDTVANALLFVAVSWFVAEMCWRLRAAQDRARDLSDRLAHRNRVLDAILASTPVATIDRDGRVRFLTTRACAVLGASAEAAVGRDLADFIQDFRPDQLTDGADAVWTGRRPDGVTYPVSIQVGLIPENADGVHATLCLTDLTQAHAANARARELHAQLNRVWRLNSLGEMAASLAHELNQPLTAATTYLHASQDALEKVGLMGQSAGRTIDLAKAQLLRAGAIIRRMRELLAHESRSLQMERVSAMVADLRGILLMIQNDAGVRIEADIDDLNDHVRAERIQFQQAIVNLIRNAAEALQGREDGRIRVIGRARSDTVFEVRVEDSGEGVVPEQLETIFRPLTTTKSSGMGLGLSVTRTIVESHGGTLAVERSELGGAAFVFGLMREREMEDA
nr:ATP-binding protein [Brevundimonas alba]